MPRTRTWFGAMILLVLLVASVVTLGASLWPTNAQAGTNYFCAYRPCCKGSCWLPWNWDYHGIMSYPDNDPLHHNPNWVRCGC